MHVDDSSLTFGGTFEIRCSPTEYGTIVISTYMEGKDALHHVKRLYDRLRTTSEAITLNSC